MIYNKFKIQDLCHKHNIDILKFDRPVKEPHNLFMEKKFIFLDFLSNQMHNLKWMYMN